MLRLMIVVLAVAQVAAQRPAATGEAYVRERADATDSLLVSMFMNAGKTAEVRVDLPSDRDLVAAYLPEGWTTEQKGRSLRAFGPPVDEANLRFELPRGRRRDYESRRVTLSAVGEGTTAVARVTSTVTALDLVSVTPNLQGILSLTPQASAGQPMLVGVSDAYRRGRWDLLVDGQPGARIVPLETLAEASVATDVSAELRSLAGHADILRILGTPAPRPWITVFPDAGEVTGVRFTDRWGEVLVDAPVAISRQTVAPSCPLTIGGASEFAFAGQSACVSGCFPGLASPYTLTLDGREVTPWAVSPTTALIGIPADLPPGPHVIETPGGGSRITVGVLQVEGSIDQDTLWRGQATQMRLRVLGTDKPLSLSVLNRTPGVIAIDGGVHQVVTTSGGATNALERSVRGIRRGNFEISYSLDVPGCGTASAGGAPSRVVAGR